MPHENTENAQTDGNPIQNKANTENMMPFDTLMEKIAMLDKKEKRLEKEYKEKMELLEKEYKAKMDSLKKWEENLMEREKQLEGKI